ncbi:hypothetical protein NQ317_006614 [Molorchus minor]|uniref:Protein sleepless n=1 Tax=Molorchus minor TaxID=1323400 RepID=A0ABQ9JZN1_9CUCU|nr:hypothetical protein NQ317_006614 [Molorchus minor]
MNPKPCGMFTVFHSEIFILIVQLEQLVIFIPCEEATSQEEIVEVELEAVEEILLICSISKLLEEGQLFGRIYPSLLRFKNAMSDCVRCYECVARLGPGETSACLYGDEAQLRRVHCIGPSVCAAYHYQSKVVSTETESVKDYVINLGQFEDVPKQILTTVIPGTPTINHITRGCQALRYGATCEDIFNELRMRNEILPGQHTCTTCSTDLCNSSTRIQTLPLVLSIIFAFSICITIPVLGNDYRAMIEVEKKPAEFRIKHENSFPKPTHSLFALSGLLFNLCAQLIHLNKN